MPMTFDDTSLIYTGQWEIGGTPSEYRSTTHGTNEAGASASFTFFGTSISVYGTIAANAKRATSTYTMDRSYPATFTANPIKIVQYKQLFYQVSDLPYGWHNLVITCKTDKAQFWLDYVVVGNEASSTTSTTLIPLILTTQPVTELPSKASTTLSTAISTLDSSASKSILALPSSTVTSFAGVPTVTPSPVSTPTSFPTWSKSANSDITLDFTHNSTSSFQATIITPSSSVVSLAFPSPSTSESSGNYVPPGSSSQVTSAPSGNHAGAIAGGVIATLVCIALAIATFLWFRRRRAMRAPSRQAPRTPDPNWFKGHSFQWPNEKPAQTGQPTLVV